MVKKCSKAGLHTGNTIRLPGGHPFLQKYQKYSYFVADSNSLDRHQYRRLGDIMKVLPSPDGHLQYSMNKKKRWELPHLVQSKVVDESDNSDLSITVTEHTLRVGQGEDDHNRFCTAYYSNNGPVTEKRSQSDMNMKSAKQSYIEADHLSRQERRQVKKSVACAHNTGIELEEEVDDFPSYSCHIVHGAPTNGRLYKDLTTKGILITRSSKRNNTFGHSKLDKRRVYEDDLDLYTDEEEVEASITHEQTTPSSRDVPLVDLIVQRHRGSKKKHRHDSVDGFVVV